MTTISARVVADSINSKGDRLTTLECRYPLFIHAQIMTHRAFSRNAASNRAIPVKKLIERTRKDMAIPTLFGANQPGMQAGEEVSNFSRLLLSGLWKLAGHTACNFAYLAQWLGLHKQHANRLMMPFQHIDVIISSTEWDNFFKLRLDSASQPEIQRLAQEIADELTVSTPVKLEEGEWHLPYIGIGDKDLTLEDQKLVSAARCARVSYLNHDKTNPDRKKDLALAKSLAESGHWSPFEHVAVEGETHTGNFKGWKQFRKILESHHD